MKSKSTGGGTTVLMRIATLLVVPGVLSLLLSVLYESHILAFIGLGLSFWGALFFLVKPIQYVEGDLLDNFAVSTYSTYDRILKEFNYKCRAQYIAPYPKTALIPEHLKGLENMVVLVSLENELGMPSLDDMAGGKFAVEKPKGVLLTPPGLGILNRMEKRFSIDFTNMEITELCEILPRFFVENFNLARNMVLSLEGEDVHVKISNSLSKNLYSKENNLKSVSFLGCPIASAVACSLAKASGKTAVITKQKLSDDNLIVEVWIRLGGA